jgi:hypothetical protein
LTQHSRGSTVDRVVDIQDEQQPDEDTGRHPSFSSGSYATTGGGYTTQSDDQYSSSYYTSVQTASSYYPQQTQSWSSQYVTSTSGGYESAYYGSSSVPTSSQSYDAGYYGGAYPAYSQQAWTSNADPRAFVGTGTAYDALNDLPVEPSRRNAELINFCEQERRRKS